MDPAIDIVRRHVSSQITELQDIKERKYRNASGSAEPAEFSSLQHVDAEQNKPGQDEDKEQGNVGAQNCQVVSIQIRTGVLPICVGVAGWKRKGDRHRHRPGQANPNAIVANTIRNGGCSTETFRKILEIKPVTELNQVPRIRLPEIRKLPIRRTGIAVVKLTKNACRTNLQSGVFVVCHGTGDKRSRRPRPSGAVFRIN
jgi:hypothetical protein